MTTTLKRAAGAATLLLVGATLCAAAAPADVVARTLPHGRAAAYLRALRLYVVRSSCG